MQPFVMLSSTNSKTVGSAHPRVDITIEFNTLHCPFLPIKEIITDIKEMAKGMMREFYRRNHGVKPERILFYRDGVSEGQFQSVSVGNMYLLFV